MLRAPGKMDQPIIKVDRLAIAYETRKGDVNAVRDVSFERRHTFTGGRNADALLSNILRITRWPTFVGTLPAAAGSLPLFCVPMFARSANIGTPLRKTYRSAEG